MEYQLAPDFQQKKRALLQAKGFSPDEFDLDTNSWTIVPRQQKAAGTGETLLTQAAANIPEAGESLLGARVASTALKALPGPLRLVGSALGAFAAPALLSRINQQVKEAAVPGISEKLATMEQDKPITSAIGGQLGALPFFRPTLNPFKSSLPNVAVATGMGAGMSAAGDLMQGQEIDPSRALISAAANLMLSEPTGLGRRLGGLTASPKRAETPVADTATPEAPPVQEPQYGPEIYQALRDLEVGDFKTGTEVQNAIEPIREILAMPEKRRKGLKKQLKDKIDLVEGTRDLADEATRVEIDAEIAQMRQQLKNYDIAELFQVAVNEARQTTGPRTQQQTEAPFDTGEQTYEDTGFEGWKPKSPVEKPIEYSPLDTSGAEPPRTDATEPNWIKNDPSKVQANPNPPSDRPVGWENRQPIIPPHKPLPKALQDALAMDENPQNNERPELAMAGTTEETPTPEPRSIIEQQVSLTADPKSARAATLVTQGSAVPRIPPELRAMDTPHGTVIWNPRKTTVDAVRRAASGRTFDARLLGMSEQTRPTETPKLGSHVVTSTVHGVPNVSAELVNSQEGIAKAAEAARMAAPGSKVEVKKPSYVTEERLKMEAEERANAEKQAQLKQRLLQRRAQQTQTEINQRIKQSRQQPQIEQTSPDVTGLKENLELRQVRRPDQAKKLGKQKEWYQDERQDTKYDPNKDPERLAGDDEPDIRHSGFGFSRDKIKSKYGLKEEPDLPNRTGGNILKSETDKLHAVGPEHASLADAWDRTFNKRRELTGRYQNPIIGSLEKLNKSGQQRVYEVFIEEDRTGKKSNVNLNAKETAAYKTIRDTLELMADDQIADGQQIVLKNGVRRVRGKDPFFAPNVTDRGVQRIIAEGQGTKQYNELKADFIKWQTQRGISPVEAEKRFKAIQGSFSKASEGNAASFKGVRLPEGVGLPDSWIERDPIHAFRTYINRFTRDRAFYNVIEKDPKLMSTLGSESYANGKQIPKNISTLNLAKDEQVKNIFNSYLGNDRAKNEPFIYGIGRAVNSAILGGPVTKITDIATVPFKALAYTASGHEDDILKGIANWRKGYDNAFKQGFNRKGGLVVAQDILGIGEHAADKLSRLAEGITKWTGSEALELASRGLSQSVGEFIGSTHVALAKSGNKESVSFLNKLGSDWKTLSREELGTRIGQLMQGRYDVTNLPLWMVNSNWAPFFSMMKWSTEQTNNFVKYVVEPAKRGNLMPLAKTLIGGLGGGLLINELREEVSGKKPYVADWEELKKGEGKPGYNDALTYKLMGAAQVTGTAGLISELIRQGYESLTERMPQGFRYPVFEVANDITQRFTAAVKAINEGEDPLKVSSELTKDVLSHHVQIARIIKNQLGKSGVSETEKQKLDLSNMRRDEEVYNRMEGKPIPARVQTSPSYSRLTEKEFDKTGDLRIASRLAPQLIKRGIDRAKGDYDVMQSEMRKLSTIDVPGMPSPETEPREFIKYYKWVLETQGTEKAQALMREFLKGRALAKAKRSMIPTLRD